MKYNFPVLLPEGRSIEVTQPFRSDSPLSLSTAYSTSTAFHNGVDIVCGTPEETWGTPCVWPFPFSGTVYDALVDSPRGATVHAHSQIDGTDPDTGIKYSLVYLHLSAVTAPKQDGSTTEITYKQSDIIGNIGNNGFVNPPPTPENPDAGTHLHFGVGVKKPGELNYTMVDPLTIFDVNLPFRTPSGEAADLKIEVEALNKATDPSVRRGLTSLIISGARKLLGF
jgi:murein DD-endopeptidase MepM/ murein hydrolase activator NlpD